MPRNGSGTYSLVSGNPVSANTTIEASWANDTLNDIASALTASIAKDGQTVPTANLPMGGFILTGLGAGSSAGQSVRYEQVLLLAGGTVTGDVTFSGATLTLPNTGLHILDTNASHDLIIAPGSNITADRTFTLTTGDADRTLSMSGNVTFSGDFTAASGITLNGVPTLGTMQATTSGTAKTFTGIPSWVTAIDIQLNEISTNGTNNWTVQIGDAGGIEATGYSSAAVVVGGAGSTSTTHFFVTGATVAAGTYSGIISLRLVDAATFLWVCSANIMRTDSVVGHLGGGSKALSATLDRLEFAAGGNTFDAGNINIRYS